MTPVKIDADDLSALRGAGWYQVALDGFDLDFYFRPSETKRAFVFSPGWINRSTYTHPYFQRIKWFDQLDGVGISLADPLLGAHDDVQIGWFIGTRESDHSRVTAQFLASLLKHLGVPPARTLFFGSSAGGFASLAFATHLRGTHAFAVNPQTNILRFHDTAELSKMTRAGFESADLIRIERRFLARVNIAALWKKEQYVPPTNLVVNTFDDWHMRNHIIPLIGSLATRELASNVDLKFFSDSEAGHNPPGPGLLIPLLKKALP